MKRVITSLLAILFVLPMVFPLAACTTETGGENVANYLYNGVELPDINEVWTDKETYSNAFISKVADSMVSAVGFEYQLLVAATVFEHDATGSNPMGVPAIFSSGPYIQYTLSDGAWNQVDSGTVGSVAFHIEGMMSVIWANTDVPDFDGSVYLAASTPVPVGGSKLTISTGGSANGDGMALYNGVMLLKLPDGIDLTATPYLMLAHMSDMAMLYVSSVPYVNEGTYIACEDSSAIETYMYDPHGLSGTVISDWTYGGSLANGPDLDILLWCNTDILNSSDSSVYLSASDPIPLDGMNVITWDGDTTGLPSVADYPFYKVTNDVPDEEVLENGFVYVVGGGLIDLSDSVETNGDIVMLGIDAAIIAKTDGAVLGDIPFPEKGIYFPATDEIYTSALAYPASSGGSVTDTTATVNFSCKDLLYTDPVYRIKAWVYEPSGWSYNGVEMPELPVVDGCPYAVMYKSNNSYDLFLSAQKLYVNEGKTATYVSEAGDFVFYSEYISKSKQWHYQNTYPFSKDELHSRFSLANLCWSNYDILNADGSVYLAASEPVPGGLDVTQPATWTSDLFAGPSHSESHTFTGLTPATEYGIYAVIWSETDGAATEHNATATFTTLEGEAPTGTIQFGAVNITGTGFTAVIEASGLDDATAYTAEIVVYNTATSAVAAEAVRSFTGNYTMAIDFAGLTPETDYTVSVDVYPTDTGKVVARGEFPVATGVEEPTTSWRDSFLLGFASGLGCTAATKTDADHNAWMQGYLVGDALRAAITTQQGFRYEVPDLQATVRMVAECFTESGDTLLFNAHNGSMILGVSTPNEATFTDRTDVTKYLIPIPAEASKVTVETSDPKVTLAQFIGVNGSGGNYTQVFSSAREAVYSYEFEKGTAQYMAIDLIYEDKGAVTVPWDYVLADTTVTFT